MRHSPNFIQLPLLLAVAILAAHPAQADAPSGRYTVLASATVVDNEIGLLWQQSVPTTGGDDGAGHYAWGTAKAYCSSLNLNGGGWRLPTIGEVLTLVDLSRTGPSIDLTAFPNTPSAGTFWASTPVAATPSKGWHVDFSKGGASGTDPGPFPLSVRCVR